MTIRVAQMRGNGLSDRETKMWDYLPAEIEQTVFMTKGNVYPQSSMPHKLVNVRATTDNVFTKHGYKYALGQYQRWFGIEEKLKGFDIVHAGETFNYYTYQAVQAKKKYGHKVVAIVWENVFGKFEYNYWPGFKMPPKYWRDRLAHIVETNVKGVDMFLPTTTDAAELLIDQGVDESRIQVMVPGIVPPVAQAKAEYQARLQGKDVYLVVNRMVKEKGVYDVIHAWRRYMRKTQNSASKVLVMVGNGPEFANLVRLAKDWGMYDKEIIFLDQISYVDLISLYPLAKLLILGSVPKPDWIEQFGYVLGEAIQSGVPVLSTTCGVIPEVAGTAGHYVPPAHPVALSDALVVLDDADAYGKIKAGCVVEAKKFEAQHYADQLANVYRSLV